MDIENEAIVVDDCFVDTTATTDEVMEYPCCMYEGTLTLAALKFINKANVVQENTLPLYARIEGLIRKVGRMELTLDAIMFYKLIGFKSVNVVKNAQVSIPIDFESADDLVKFIKL